MMKMERLSTFQLVSLDISTKLELVHLNAYFDK